MRVRYSGVELLELDDMLEWYGYPEDHEAIHAMFESDEAVARHVIIGYEPVFRTRTAYSHVCIALMGGSGYSEVIPLPCFVLAHTDVIDLAAATRNLLRRLGVYSTTWVHDLLVYDARDKSLHTLIDAQYDTYERRYEEYIDGDGSEHAMTCLVLHLDVPWHAIIRHGFSRDRAMDRVRRTIFESVERVEEEASHAVDIRAG
jgi:hypothetical protein